MSTLGALKARVADDIVRSDLSTQIANAITDAINHYKEERFFFSETRDLTFPTIVGQSFYDSDDDADIPKFLTLDMVFLDDGTQRYELTRQDPTEIEWMIGNNPSETRPFAYAYFNQGFYLYPVPDAAYTVRPMGHIEVDAPTSDDEVGNVWMTKAFELIRCRAKVYLFAHTIKDAGQAAIASEGERSALEKLRRETSRRVGSGRIKPTQF